MTKQERLQEIYSALRSRGIVRNKKDLAQMLGVNYGGFVEAMKGSNTARLTCTPTRTWNQGVSPAPPARMARSGARLSRKPHRNHAINPPSV